MSGWELEAAFWWQGMQYHRKVWVMKCLKRVFTFPGVYGPVTELPNTQPDQFDFTIHPETEC